MVALERLEEDEVAAFVASGMPPPVDWMSADVTEMPATAPVHRANPDPNPSSKAPNDTGSWDTDSASTGAGSVLASTDGARPALGMSFTSTRCSWLPG